MFTKGPFSSIFDIERRHRGHWFDTDTKHWFRCRVGQNVYGGRYFTTSEQNVVPGYCSEPRAYTIRRAEDNGDINTVGVFNRIASSASARNMVQRLIELQEKGLTEAEAILKLQRDIMTDSEIEQAEAEIARAKAEQQA